MEVDLNSSRNSPGGIVMQTPMKRQEKNHKGMTGLETAIVIIAFVVVAAVIAYTVLSAVSP